MEAGEEVQIARNGVPVAELLLPAVKSRPLSGDCEPIAIDISEDLVASTKEMLDEWEQAMARKDKLLVELMEELALEKAPSR